MRALRRKIMVVVAVFTVAVAGLALARSLPFADRSQPPTTRNATQAAATGAGAAAGALNRLPVKGKAAMTGYTRTQFGQAWTDDTDRELTRPWGHNGCDTRDDALARDLVEAHLKPGSRCVVVSGRLHDPYTGSTLAWRRGRHTSTTVQIDHVVALGNAWVTGAQHLPAPTRRALANDPLNLVAVDGPANEAKRDGDAATWLPPNKAYRCDYVARQIAVKTKYQLWVTPAENRYGAGTRPLSSPDTSYRSPTMTTHWIPEQLLEPGVGVILDTETTDLDGRIIEISIIDAATGTVLMDQLINPSSPAPPTTPTRSTKLKPNLPSPSETSTNSSTPPTMHERTIAYRPAFLRDVKRLKNKHYNMNTHSNGR